MGHRVETLCDADATAQLLHEQYGGSLRLLEDVARIVREEMPGRMAALADAVRLGDAAAIEAAAHKVRGGLLLFGNGNAEGEAEHLELDAERGEVTSAADRLMALERAVAEWLKALDRVTENCHHEDPAGR
ncbi:MAG: hypothetical protein NW201_05330 [Gemmatimonadales bacterium]|nr:hypothetical protein [Gemmatimonadales bacterium]